MTWEYMVYTAIALLVIVIAGEWLRGHMMTEGFTDGVVPEFFGRYFPKRSDVVPGQDREEDGWIRNPRYFEGYVDLQRLGYKADFCRVIEKENMPESRIVACALAGQEGLDSITYRTESMRTGMRFSRDDYFRDVNDDGRDDYGRILKTALSPNDAWQALVVPAGITRFKQGTEIPDNSPPPAIADLLWFFEGIMIWYRFFDDMLDYGENTQMKIAGDVRVNEEPRRVKTAGAELNKLHGSSSSSSENGVKPTAEQYLKIGENSRLEFDTIVQLRQLRAVSVWAYFDEFSNNARIFDFGNGAGHDNVLLGIEGRGNGDTAFGNLGRRPADDNQVCSAKAPKEVSPQRFLETSDANVDTWECAGPEPVATTYPENEERPAVDPRANLLFEIWDTQQRKMRLRIMNCIPLRKWCHIAITTTDGSSFRPTWHVYIDGEKVYEQLDGHMPLASYTTDNYIGRSNWESDTSQYQDADERFRGALFDMRFYRTPMSKAKIERTVLWGKKRLFE
jgi:hypothetical protein